MSDRFTREVVLIPVSAHDKTENLHTWLYKPPGDGPFPVVVAGHGMTVVKAAGLADFGEAWAVRAGYASLIFDYRGFGDSGGLPRNLVSLQSQYEDYTAVITWAKDHPSVCQPDKIVVMGSALSGLSVARLLCERSDLKGGMAHCPVLDGYATLMALPANPRLLFWAAVDSIKAKLGLEPVLVSAVGSPGDCAFMTAPSCGPGFDAMFARGSVNHPNLIAPRVAFEILGARHGLQLGKSRVPMLVVMAEEDDMIASAVTRDVATRSEGKIVLVSSPGGHFDVMKGGKGFKVNIDAQVDFLNSVC